MIILENETLIASFALKGAELQSLKDKTTNQEYIWNADPEFWAKHSPVLFPIVGALKDNTYYYQGKAYQLSRHGFARDHEFKAEMISNTEVLFTLTQSEDTLRVYPFKFSLCLRYNLSAQGISCSYEVTNPGDEQLLFSIGGHPAFATPANAEISYEDYQLTFNRDTVLKYHKIQDNLIAEETGELLLDDHKLRLQHELFYNDALVFKSLQSNEISLTNTISKEGLVFHFEGFPYFGIWAAEDADFVCLEPWCGIADGIGTSQQLEEKEGIVSLAPLQKWQRTWSVKIILPKPATS